MAQLHLSPKTSRSRWAASLLGLVALFHLAAGISQCGEDDDDSPSPSPSPTPLPPAYAALNEINCNGDDWAEVVNLSATQAIDLSGWILSDDPTLADHRYEIPGGVMLPENGRMLLVSSAIDPAGFTFGIKCGTDTVTLMRADETLEDQILLPAISSANSYGRLPDRTGDWQETAPTQGAPNAEPGSSGDAAAWLFNPFRVVTVDLTLSQSAMDQLAVDPYSYVEGTFKLSSDVENSSVMTVGIRLKGQYGSYRTLDQKAAFKVKFNEYVDGQKYAGLKKLTLNNMVQDPSMIHEVLAYSIFRSFDVAAPRTGYAWVRVNGADYGLYSDIETLDDVSLPLHFASTQHLYEGAYGVDVYPDHVDYFEVDEGDEVDRTDLSNLATVANETASDAWITSLSPLVDFDQMRRMWATELYIGHWDGYAWYANNYYLHSDALSYFAMLPWGTDQTFSSLLAYHSGSGFLFSRCMGILECQDAYDQSLASLLPVVDALSLDPYAESLANFLYPWVDADPRKEYSTADVAANVQYTRDFLAYRRVDAETWLECELDANCNDCTELVRGDHSYRICTHERTYNDARAACQSHDMDLVILDARGEQTWVQQAMSSSIGLRDSWIGLSDQIEEGHFEWWDGSEPSFTAWNSGEPNDYGGEDCGELLSNGFWNDLPCTAALSTLCEQICSPGEDGDNDGYERCGEDCDDRDPAINPAAVEVCGDGIDQDCSGKADDYPPCPDCYESWRGPHRYLVCPDFRSWQDGRTHCQDMGSDYVIVNDGTENSWIVEQMYAYVGGYDSWIGLSDEALEGTFTWWDGSIPTYAPWSSGEPNDWGGEDCAEIYWTAQWNDLPCGYTLPQICEDTCESGEDSDNDGYERCGTDCDDGDPRIHPEAIERCSDGTDQDCDGVVDENPGCVP